MNLTPLPGIYSAESLRKWLRARIGGFVGQKCDGERCPAAEWLTSLVGAKANAFVSEEYVCVGDHCYETPDWLARFVLTVDVVRKGKLKATADEALAALDAADRVPPPVHELAVEINRRIEE